MSRNWRAACVRVRGTVGVAVNWDIAGSSLSWVRKLMGSGRALAGTTESAVMGWERDAMPGRGGASQSRTASGMGVSGWVEASTDHSFDGAVAAAAAAPAAAASAGGAGSTEGSGIG
jgi:hypothetical protein